MKIKEGINLKPTFDIPGYGKRGVEIPDTNREDFAKFLYEYGFRTGVEIGIDRGEYGITLCNAGLKMYGVDSFQNYRGYKRVGRYESHLEIAQKNLKDYDYTIINKFSMDALDNFKDNSIDFVYIDGNHTLPYITADIFGWERKVKHGGIISGHDYAVIVGDSERGQRGEIVYDGCHVKLGVNASVEVMRIKRLYVLGKREKIEGLKRDKWRTWFFFKP